MDDKLYQDDFEEFLQNQVRNHRMYPSDTVWRKINKELHGDKNWPALTIAAFVILIATVAVSVHFSPKPNIFAIETDYNNQKSNTANSTNTTDRNSTASFLNNTQKHYSVSNNDWFTNGDTIKNANVSKYVPAANTNISTLAEKDKTLALNSSDRSIAPASLSKSVPIITSTNRQEDITNTSSVVEGIGENTLSQPLNLTAPIIKNDTTIKQKQPVVQTQRAKQEFNDRN
nr:hypothetical protein [Segetibacter sp.]